ncbi:mitochondrial splicing system protein [Diatrype stigma]|uniref:Mitochondrial splicing system protein n=1 Tax=Diatrype stigma TaxID=117547 RepID=A0AAN9UP87_9PEZI
MFFLLFSFLVSSNYRSSRFKIYHGLCPTKSFPKPRYASVRTLYDPGPPVAGVSQQQQDILDSEALVLYFPAPHTVTGEDVLELHVHGGSATVKAVLSAIPRCATTSNGDAEGGGGGGGGPIRYAEPGEFTRRAFLNDRLDLAQVEALSATLAAETEQQRRAAVRGHSGALGRAYEGWRRQLLAARAELEALIDFAEDQHLDDGDGGLWARGVTAQVRAIAARLAVHEEAGRRGELLRGGARVALLGPPNAGKSSLMNRLVGREASIVSRESGTTRDVVEARLDMRGYLCTFADTAGFRSAATAAAVEGLEERGQTEGGGGGDAAAVSTGEKRGEIGAIEREGIRRARAKALEADVVVVLASIEPSSSTPGGHEIRYDLETLRLAASCPQRLIVVNKSDAVSSPSSADSELAALVEGFQRNVLDQIEGLEAATTKPILISCKEAESVVDAGVGAAAQGGGGIRGSSSSSKDPGGIRAVADHLVAAFAAMTDLPAELQDLHGVTERQRQLLAQCRAQLEEYLDMVGGVRDFDPDGGGGDGDEPDITVAAEHLRYAANCLGRITGRGEGGDVEEILGVIFEK